jgi:tRNA threonylcarbamoyladenosine dehydratase
MNNLEFISDKIKSELLLELWENSIFDKNSLELLEKLIIKQSNSINPYDISVLEVASEEILRELSTIRNRNLISIDNQEKLKTTVVGFFGLSVGSHAALTWSMESRAKSIKLVDPDFVSGSNLNRLRTGWQSVGMMKTDVVKKQILEINPNCEVIATQDVSPAETEKLFTTKPNIDVIIDAIDDLSGKILLRKYARRLRIPLIMATDVGDNVILDIERYDLEPQPEFFLGRVSGIEYIDLSRLSFFERIKITFKIVGFEENSVEMLDSLLSIGKNLATWPQLGATATIAGGIITTAIKKIVTGEDVKSGRYYFSLDSLLVSGFNSQSQLHIRNEKIKTLTDKFKLDKE